jgi:hypothetical protein
MTARIYDRPDLDQQFPRPVLFVTGKFAFAEPFVPYEGRLQIVNGVGTCLVRQIDGDRLPEGTQVFVDQSTKQVVVTWPAYMPGQAPISNPGFESGNTGWAGGNGWTIATENPPSGSWAAGYLNNQGESVISNNTRYSVYPGQTTRAKCKVRQGASSEGNAGASVMLEYRNAAGEVIKAAEGNRVMSASKNRVYDSNVTGIAPAGAETINIAGNGIRFRENKILFVDDFEWDHTVAAAGLSIERTFQVSLLVSDSTGRSYLWVGSIICQKVTVTGVVRSGPLASSTGFQIGQVAYSRIGRKFHACKTTRQTSVDGATWTVASTADYEACAVNTDTGAFVGLLGTTLIVETAPDVLATVSSNTADAYRNLSYGDGKCVGMGGSYTSAGYSGAWTAGSAGQGMNFSASPARWFPEASLWVAIDTSYNIVTSPNALSWTNTGINIGNSGAALSEAPAYSPIARALVIHGGDANVRRFDGTTWQTINLPNPSSNAFSKANGKIIYAARLGMFVLVSMYGLYTSVDGLAWTKVASPAADGSPFGFITVWNAVGDGDDRIVFITANSGYALLFTNAPEL